MNTNSDWLISELDRMANTREEANKLTPDEVFRQKVESMPDTELLELSAEWVTKLCTTGGRAWTLCVPPSKKDPDMVFSELARRYRKLIESPTQPEQ